MRVAHIKEIVIVHITPFENNLYVEDYCMTIWWPFASLTSGTKLTCSKKKKKKQVDMLEKKTKKTSWLSTGLFFFYIYIFYFRVTFK